jgi:ORF6N domain-containing protein
MLDADLADLYGVPSSALVRAVKRTRERFPSDFMFQLTEQEVSALKSQSVTLPDMAQELTKKLDELELRVTDTTKR